MTPTRIARIAGFLVFGLVLAACAASERPVRAVASAPAPAEAAPEAGQPRMSAAAGLLARAGGRDAPSLEQIERALGAADLTRREGAGAMLTYRAGTCSLALVFAADAQGAMRLQTAQALPSRAGGAAPALGDCAAAVEGRRGS